MCEMTTFYAHTLVEPKFSIAPKRTEPEPYTSQDKLDERWTGEYTRYQATLDRERY